MKVLNLRCANGHVFEGWFGSEGDYMDQNGRGLIDCPLCADRVIARMPSAPRLNLSGVREPASVPPADAAGSGAGSGAGTGAGHPVPVPADMQAAWLGAVRKLMAETEDVGERFPEEARRIHYGETAQRGIRGQASPQERAALHEEGIEVMALPLPTALKGPVQ